MNSASAENEAPGGGPFFSLVTTCKGRGDDLAASLATWLNLTDASYEVVVVDFDCPDKAGDRAEILFREAAPNPWLTGLSVVRIADRPLFNLCEARNAGLLAAQGEVALLLDADVSVADPNLLAKLRRCFDEGALFVGSVQFIPSESLEGQLYCFHEYGVATANSLIIPTGALNAGLTGSAAFLLDAARVAGLFDSRINESGYGSDDIEFYLRYANLLYGGSDENARTFLLRFGFFPDGALIARDNPEEEKHRFYRMPVHDSAALNKGRVAEMLEALDAKAAPRGCGREPLILGRGWPLEPPLWVSPWFPLWYYYWYGVKLAERGELELHRDAFPEGLFADPGSKFAQPNRVRYLLASLAHRLGRFDLAGPLFEAILADPVERSPHLLSGANYFLGAEALSIGEHALAAGFFRACLAVNADHRGANAGLDEAHAALLGRNTKGSGPQCR